MTGSSRKPPDTDGGDVDQERDLDTDPDRPQARAPSPDWVEHVVVHKKDLPGPLFRIAWLMMTLLLAMLVGWLIGTGMCHLGNEIAGGSVM